MSSQPVSNGLSSVLEFHEDRIQNLETDRNELHAMAARTSVQIEHLKESVDRLGDTLGGSIHALAASLEHHAEETKQRFMEHSTKFASIDAARKASAARWSFLRRGTVPVMTAAATAVVTGVATKYGESIWSWIAGR